jgi:hypothetical protein
MILSSIGASPARRPTSLSLNSDRDRTPASHPPPAWRPHAPPAPPIPSPSPDPSTVDPVSPLFPLAHHRRDRPHPEHDHRGALAHPGRPPSARARPSGRSSARCPTGPRTTRSSSPPRPAACTCTTSWQRLHRRRQLHGQPSQRRVVLPEGHGRGRSGRLLDTLANARQRGRGGSPWRAAHRRLLRRARQADAAARSRSAFV